MIDSDGTLVCDFLTRFVEGYEVNMQRICVDEDPLSPRTSLRAQPPNDVCPRRFLFHSN
jgi:hypothetical protein